MSLDIKKTTDIVDTWFKHQHEKVIGKLSQKPEIQLDYVERILKDKEEEIEKLMNIHNTGSEESEEYQFYSWLLELHVELLCDLKPDQVITAVRKKYYPAVACLNVVKKKELASAIAYLLKRSGDYASSLKEYLRIMKKIGNKLLDESQKEESDKNLAEFIEYFNLALKVCAKNAKVTSGDESSQALWFDLLDYLYAVLMKAKQLSEGEIEHTKLVVYNALITKITTRISNCIKDILTRMMMYVAFPTIMTRLSEQHGELEIESFKEMFTSMLSSYYYNEKILETASKIISNDVVSQFKALSSMRCKGFPVTNAICVKCERPINPKGVADIAIFQCGHAHHSTCLKDLTAGCYACTYREVSIFSIKLII